MPSSHKKVFDVEVEEDLVVPTDESPPPRPTATTNKAAASASSSAKTKKNKDKKKHNQEELPTRTKACPAAAAASSLKKPPSKSTSSSQKKKRQRKSKQAAAAASTTNDDDQDDQATPLVPTKPPPTMDVAVHRLRHLQYQPSAIVCIRAYQHFLAVARENGSVELKDASRKLQTLATIPGQSSSGRLLLAWTCGAATPTLVGASSQGSIFVVDFGAAGFTNSIPSGGGAVLALASLCSGAGSATTCHCHNSDSSTRFVMAGCQDGGLRLVQVSSSASQTTRLQVVSQLASAGAAVLSLAWTRNGGDEASSSSVLYAGVADGTIRRYDCRYQSSDSEDGGTWSCTPVLRMTVASLGRNVATRVWALLALSDGTVVSGDSVGHVQIWNGNTGTLQQSLDQNDSKADVLDLAVNDDETKLFASGVDSRVVCLERAAERLSSQQSAQTPNHWILTHAQRPHTHDVRALAVCQQPAPDASTSAAHPREILVTGGVDTKLCTYQVNDFAKKRPVILYPWPSISPVSVARQARLLLMRRDDRVDLYRLAASQQEPSSLPVLVPEEETLVGTVQVQSARNLLCAAMSDDGKFLALSDTLSVLLFALTFHDGDDDDSRQSQQQGMLSPRRIPLDLPATPIVSIKFLKDDSRLVLAAANGAIHIVAISGDSDEDGDSSSDETKTEFRAVVKQTIEPADNDKKEESLLPMQSMCSSDDGEWLVTVRHGYAAGEIQVFRNDSNSQFRQWWKLPNFDSPSSAVSFLSPPLLAVACLDFSVVVVDLNKRRLSSWSEEAGFPLFKSFPSDLTKRRDYPVRVAVDPASPSKLVMGSFGAFVVFDTNDKLPKKCRIFPETHVRGKKRRRSLSLTEPNVANSEQTPLDEQSTCTLCLRYNSMLYMDFIGNHEMVVVEQPWLSVVSTFPEALSRRIYGS